MGPLWPRGSQSLGRSEGRRRRVHTRFFRATVRCCQAGRVHRCLSRQPPEPTGSSNRSCSQVQARGVTGPDPTAPHARLGISNFYILSGGGMRWEMGTHPGHAVLLKGERWPRTGRGTLAPCLPARLLLKRTDKVGSCGERQRHLPNLNCFADLLQLLGEATLELERELDPGDRTQHEFWLLTQRCVSLG